MDLPPLKITSNQLTDISLLFCERCLERYIDQGIKKQLLSVTWLASKMQMSDRHLLRIFKKQYKVTCHQYIQDKKLRKAKKLLIKRPYLSIKDISSILLFSDSKYFSKIFKRKFGLNPSVFKLKALNNTVNLSS